MANMQPSGLDSETHLSPVLQSLVLFRWVDAFMAWPSFLRLPTLISIQMLISFLLWIGGADIAAIVGLLLLVASTGSFVALLVILIQGAERDASDATIDTTRMLLSPAKAIRYTALSMLLGLATPFWFSYAYNGDPLGWLTVFTLSYLSSVSWGLIVSDWLVNAGLWLSGVTLLHIFFITNLQIRFLTSWVEAADIDLLELDRFQWLVRQPLRLLLVIAVMASLNLIIFQYIRIEGKEDFLYSMLLPSLFVMSLLAMRHLTPLVALRRRIILVKANEVMRVRAAIRGDREQLSDSQIAHVANEFSTPDLMQYEERVQNAREWPIEGAMQKVLLYGLLPPVAWVLAALVERIVDAAL